MFIFLLLVVLFLTRQRRYIHTDDVVTMIICMLIELVFEIVFIPWDLLL